MNGVLNKFRKRNIIANIYHFLLVIFVVAVSVCLLSGLFINYFTLNNAVDKFYNESHLPNLIVETNSISNKDETFFSANYEYEKRLKFDSDFVCGTKEYNAIFLVSSGKISTPYIVEGEKGVGCYVDSRFIEEYNIGINYTQLYFDFTVGTETKQIAIKVVGSMSLAEDLIVDDECVIFINQKSFLKILKIYFPDIDENDFSILNYNQILIGSQVSNLDKTKIEEYYQNSTSNLDRIYLKEELASFAALKSEINKAKQMTYTFPSLFVFISVLVIISAISQLISKERYNIGLLKSVGIGNKTILSNYCGYGSCFCFIGAVLGLIVSPLIIPNMTFEVYDKMYNLPKDEVSLICPFWFICSVLILFVIIGYFSAFFVSIKLMNKTPKECMNRSVNINLKARKKKSKFSKIFNIALRNIKINKSRTIMSVIAIFGCSTLCLIGFGVEKIFDKNNIEFFTFEVFAKIFKIFSVVLLILVVFIFLMQIFKERTKEMSLLRVHGTSYLKIWLTLVFEMIVAMFIGIIVAFSFSQIIFNVLLNIFDISGSYIIGLASYMKVLLLNFSVIMVALAIGIWKIYKLNLSDAVKISE